VRSHDDPGCVKARAHGVAGLAQPATVLEPRAVRPGVELVVRSGGQLVLQRVLVRLALQPPPGGEMKEGPLITLRCVQLCTVCKVVRRRAQACTGVHRRVQACTVVPYRWRMLSTAPSLISHLSWGVARCHY
jgi:hypothetical protein